MYLTRFSELQMSPFFPQFRAKDASSYAIPIRHGYSPDWQMHDET